MGEFRSSTGTRLASPITRRALLGGAAAAASVAFPPVARGQVATPGLATPVDGSVRSITKREYIAEVHRHFDLEEPARQGGHLLVAIEGDIDTLNPMIPAANTSFIVMSQMFSSLAQTSAIDGQWVPDLADWWEMSADGLTYTFHLDPRLAWHDGRPVTAHDCAYSFDTVFNEEGLSGVRSVVIKVVERYRAVDDYTFEVTASQPVAPNVFFLNSIGNIWILPMHVWEAIPFDDWGSVPAALGDDPTQVVGCGPFKLGEWMRGEGITLVRNDDHWPPEMIPTVDQLTLSFQPNTSSAVQAFRAGESDICNVPEAEYASLRADIPESRYLVYDESSWAEFVMNGDPARGTPFVDPRVRQAMLYAIDRDLIIDTVIQGFGVRADGIYPVPAWSYAPDRVTTIYNHDPERARALLDEAGWIAGNQDGIRRKDGIAFELEIDYTEAGPNARQIVTYMQQAWGSIGLGVQPIAYDPGIQFELGQAGDFDITYGGFGWYGEDMGDLYRCDRLPPQGYNTQRICHPEFDRLNEASIFEIDPARRRDLLIQQGNIVNDTATRGIVYFKKNIVGTHSHVHNYFANEYSLVACFPWIWLDEEA